MAGHVVDGSCTLSKREHAFPSGVWGPVNYGHGPMLFLADGRRYLDLMCGLGALTVGHNHHKVVAAVLRQVGEGCLFSLPSFWEEHVAARLCDIIPCAEQVKFVKTGSEATAAAIRIARAATGRTRVWAFRTGFHGWHDWWAVTSPTHPGVPEEMAPLVEVFDGLDAACRFAFENPPQDTRLLPAAVICEPERIGRGDALMWLVKHTRALGAKIIFDEMLSGGRLALAGAQQYYGDIWPDLATYGKAFGGGLPLAFVCGPRALMQHAWPVSGTFSGDALALAACDAMLDVYHDEDVIGRLWRNGEALLALFAGYATSPLRLTLHGLAPRFWWDYGPGIDRRLAQSVFVQQAAKGGVLVHPAVLFSSAALTPQQTTHVVGKLDAALRVVEDGVVQGNLASRLDGDMYQDSVR